MADNDQPPPCTDEATPHSCGPSPKLSSPPAVELTWYGTLVHTSCRRLKRRLGQDGAPPPLQSPTASARRPSGREGRTDYIQTNHTQCLMQDAPMSRPVGPMVGLLSTEASALAGSRHVFYFACVGWADVRHALPVLRDANAQTSLSHLLRVFPSFPLSLPSASVSSFFFLGLNLEKKTRRGGFQGRTLCGDRLQDGGWALGMQRS